MGVIEGIGTFLFLALVTIFLVTGTLFFMAATVLLEKLGDAFGKIGAIAIPMGSSKKPPITGSNSTPV